MQMRHAQQPAVRRAARGRPLRARAWAKSRASRAPRQDAGSSSTSCARAASPADVAARTSARTWRPRAPRDRQHGDGRPGPGPPLARAAGAQPAWVCGAPSATHAHPPPRHSPRPGPAPGHRPPRQRRAPRAQPTEARRAARRGRRARPRRPARRAPRASPTAPARACRAARAAAGAPAAGLSAAGAAVEIAGAFACGVLR